MPENIFPSDLWEIHNMEFSLYIRIPSIKFIYLFTLKGNGNSKVVLP